MFAKKTRNYDLALQAPLSGPEALPAAYPRKYRRTGKRALRYFGSSEWSVYKASALSGFSRSFMIRFWCWVENDQFKGGRMKRRAFVGGVFAGLAATAYAARPPKPKAGDIPRRTFGKTGEQLTVIGQAGGRFPLISFEEAKAITLRAYDLGINYFDNSVDYWDGRSEEVYGAVLPPFRKHIFLTTKANERTRVGAAAELDLSLKRLKTDYVDLWQIHRWVRKKRSSRSSVLGEPSKPSKRPRKQGSVVSSVLRVTTTRTFTLKC